MTPSRLALSPEGATVLRSGRDVVPISAADGSIESRRPTGELAGEDVTLLSPDGETLGTALVDADTGVFRVHSREERGWSRQLALERLHQAWERRRRTGVLLDADEAFRLVHDEGDALSGFTADVFGAHAILYVASRDLLPVAQDVAHAIVATSADVESSRFEPIRGVIVKLRAHARSGTGKIDQEIIGEAPPQSTLIAESGSPVRDPLSRCARSRVCTRTCAGSGPKSLRTVEDLRVLNLFAYAGGISVACARASASAVTSIDHSADALAWARANFAHSGLDPDHSSFCFESADALRYMRQAATRGEEFDVVVIDPPPVTASAPGRWSMKRDYPELIELATRVLPARGGRLWLTSNALRGRSLLRQISRGVANAGRQGDVLSLRGAGCDYPTPVAAPELRHLEAAEVEIR